MVSLCGKAIFQGILISLSLIFISFVEAKKESVVEELNEYCEKNKNSKSSYEIFYHKYFLIKDKRQELVKFSSDKPQNHCIKMMENIVKDFKENDNDVKISKGLFLSVASACQVQVAIKGMKDYVEKNHSRTTEWMSVILPLNSAVYFEIFDHWLEVNAFGKKGLAPSVDLPLLFHLYLMNSVTHKRVLTTKNFIHLNQLYVTIPPATRDILAQSFIDLVKLSPEPWVEALNKSENIAVFFPICVQVKGPAVAKLLMRIAKEHPNSLTRQQADDALEEMAKI